MTTPLSKQVVSEPLAKKLKELGYKQKSLFWWQEWFNADDHESDGWHLVYDGFQEQNHSLDISAFTASELGNLIGTGFEFDFISSIPLPEVDRLRKPKEWIIKEKNGLPEFRGNNMADALAQMLIYLYQQGVSL